MTAATFGMRGELHASVPVGWTRCSSFRDGAQDYLAITSGSDCRDDIDANYVNNPPWIVLANTDGLVTTDTVTQCAQVTFDGNGTPLTIPAAVQHHFAALGTPQVAAAIGTADDNGRPLYIASFCFGPGPHGFGRTWLYAWRQAARDGSLPAMWATLATATFGSADASAFPH